MICEIIMFLYNIASNIPFLSGIFRWILKKAGKLKDYEDLYNTDNGLKVFANSLKKIGVNFDEYLKRKEGVYLYFLFKKEISKSSEDIKKRGFKFFKRGMCWVLISNKSEEHISIKESNKIKIKLIFKINYSDICFKSDETKQEFLNLISPDLLCLFDKFEFISYAKRTQKIKTYADLITSTPLQLMFADFVSLQDIKKIFKNEDDILKKLEEKKSIKKPYLLHLKDIKNNILIDELKRQDVDVTSEIVDKAKKHADFIVNKLHL